jgi:NAD-dependent DNA ligase
MGQILAYLLGADAEAPVDSAVVKGLACAPPVKAIIQRAIGDRRKRYPDAAAMLAAMERTKTKERRRIPLPTSLKGKVIVFTGVLSRMSRRAAAALAERAGARVQPKVTSATDIVVRGASADIWKADDKGQKLLDVDRERERGHEICVIDERRFVALVQQA